MKNFKKILKNNLGSTLGTAALDILSSLAMVFAGYSLSFLFTAYEYEGDKVKAILYTLVVELVIWSAAMGLYYLSSLARAKIRQSMKNDLRAMVGKKIAGLDYREFVSKDCGNYVSWLTNDVEQIYEQSFSSLFSGIKNFATTLFSLGALFLLSPYIGVAAMVLFVIISVLPQFLNRYLQKANAAQSQALEVSVERYKDAIMGGSIFFLANLRERITQRIVGASREAEKACCRFKVTNAAVQVCVEGISLNGQIVLTVAALLTAALGAAPTGAVLSVGNLAGSFFNGAGNFVQALLTLKASKPLWEKFEDAQVHSAPKQALRGFKTISLNSVSFAYDEKTILHNQNYTFKAGEKYAIIGESGSGKTTLTRILLGLLPNYTGDVYYDQVEQRSVSPESIYDHIAYVDQQVYLFQDTLRFNITLGRPYSDGEVMDVIRRCRLESFVASLPEGLDTMISENGKNLSGGQRQRIALARALIQQVEFVIVDEGTSALDEANALEIEASLFDDPNLGVIIITHHLRESLNDKLTGIYSLAQPAVCG